MSSSDVVLADRVVVGVLSVLLVWIFIRCDAISPPPRGPNTLAGNKAMGAKDSDEERLESTSTRRSTTLDTRTFMLRFMSRSLTVARIHSFSFFFQIFFASFYTLPSYESGGNIKMRLSTPQRSSILVGSVRALSNLQTVYLGEPMMMERVNEHSRLL